MQHPDTIIVEFNRRDCLDMLSPDNVEKLNVIKCKPNKTKTIPKSIAYFECI